MGNIVGIESIFTNDIIQKIRILFLNKFNIETNTVFPNEIIKLIIYYIERDKKIYRSISKINKSCNNLIKEICEKIDPDYLIQFYAKNGNKDKVIDLLNNPRVDPSDDGHLVLYLAYHNNHEDIVNILMKDPTINIEKYRIETNILFKKQIQEENNFMKYYIKYISQFRPQNFYTKKRRNGLKESEDIEHKQLYSFLFHNVINDINNNHNKRRFFLINLN